MSSEEESEDDEEELEGEALKAALNDHSVIEEVDPTLYEKAVAAAKPTQGGVATTVMSRPKKDAKDGVDLHEDVSGEMDAEGGMGGNSSVNAPVDAPINIGGNPGGMPAAGPAAVNPDSAGRHQQQLQQHVLQQQQLHPWI